MSANSKSMKIYSDKSELVKIVTVDSVDILRGFYFLNWLVCGPESSSLTQAFE